MGSSTALMLAIAFGSIWNCHRHRLDVLLAYVGRKVKCLVILAHVQVCVEFYSSHASSASATMMYVDAVSCSTLRMPTGSRTAGNGWSIPFVPAAAMDASTAEMLALDARTRCCPRSPRAVLEADRRAHGAGLVRVGEGLDRDAVSRSREEQEDSAEACIVQRRHLRG